MVHLSQVWIKLLVRFKCKSLIIKHVPSAHSWVGFWVSSGECWVNKHGTIVFRHSQWIRVHVTIKVSHDCIWESLKCLKVCFIKFLVPETELICFFSISRRHVTGYENLFIFRVTVLQFGSDEGHLTSDITRHMWRCFVPSIIIVGIHDYYLVSRCMSSIIATFAECTELVFIQEICQQISNLRQPQRFREHRKPGEAVMVSKCKIEGNAREILLKPLCEVADHMKQIIMSIRYSREGVSTIENEVGSRILLSHMLDGLLFQEYWVVTLVWSILTSSEAVARVTVSSVRTRPLFIKPVWVCVR